MPTNDSIFEKWNDLIYKDDIFAPWNDPMKKDDVFACWNNIFGQGEYRDEVDKF